MKTRLIFLIVSIFYANVSFATNLEKYDIATRCNFASYELLKITGSEYVNKVSLDWLHTVYFYRDKLIVRSEWNDSNLSQREMHNREEVLYLIDVFGAKSTYFNQLQCHKYLKSI